MLFAILRHISHELEDARHPFPKSKHKLQRLVDGDICDRSSQESRITLPLWALKSAPCTTLSVLKEKTSFQKG